MASARTRKRKTRSRKRPAATRKRRSPARARRQRRRLGLLLAIAAALALGGFAGSQESLQDLLPDQIGSDAGGSARGSGPGETDVDADRARERLAELTVAEWEQMRGYSRDRFSHWLTVDGCDVRQTVLARDGDDIESEEDSCRVTGGSWYSAFDGATLTDPGDVDIDHMVPLANAWRTGASQWDDDRRADFANDLDTPQLIAVSASSNRAKGDQDPSQWQPDRAYWCQYAHDWVAVKHHWELSVTEAEQAALSDMLDTCDD